MNISNLRNHLLLDVSLGTWMQIPSPIVANLLSLQKFDWVVLDLEHGRFNNSLIGDLFNVIKSNGCLPFARLLSSCSQHEISRVLDAGASGLIFPKVEFVDQARDIYKYSRLPPNGSRGVSFCHANNYGHDFEEYLVTGQSPFLVGMIESLYGVQNLKKIICENIFDAFIIGPYDLSASLGVTGEFSDPIFLKVLDSIYDTLKSARVPFGSHIVHPSASDLRNSIDRGCSFIPYGIDTTILSNIVPSI